MNATIVYKFTMINGRKSTVNQILASSTLEALITGLRTSLPLQGPVKITCKPARRIP